MKTLTVLLHIHGGDGFNGLLLIAGLIILIVALSNRKSNNTKDDDLSKDDLSEDDHFAEEIIKAYKNGIEIGRKEARHE